MGDSISEQDRQHTETEGGSGTESSVSPGPAREKRGRGRPRGSKTGTVIQNKPMAVDVLIPPVDTDSDNKDSTTTTKKPRGRPKGSKNRTSGNMDATITDTIMLVNALYGGAALLLGKHWELDAKEAQCIGEPMGRILHRNLSSETVSSVADPIALLLSLVIVTIPRITSTFANKEDKTNDAERTIVSSNTNSGGKQSESDDRSIKGLLAESNQELI